MTLKVKTYKMFVGEVLEQEFREEISSSGKPNKSENSTSSDCVDRHSVELLAYRYLKEPTDNHVAFYEDFLDLPSVTPIRPKGHWIDHSDEGYVECPKCGSATNCDDNIDKLHFCFSCGAEMEGSEQV